MPQRSQVHRAPADAQELAGVAVAAAVAMAQDDMEATAAAGVVAQAAG